MTFDEIDEETTVSEKEAVHELKKHSINFSVLFGGDIEQWFTFTKTPIMITKSLEPFWNSRTKIVTS